MAVSLLIGNHWTPETASRYVLRGESPTPKKLASVALRVTTAGRLREAGFAVVHTTGKIKDSPHVSVVFPAVRPFDEFEVPWPPAVSERFGACFTGDGERGGAAA
ncbi:hypothetical protein LO762_15500 [Actinocorallia sp. API 0066]|uniref:hypothetical protein n=1 Tax=Actinocorallia sp. API 0066 TaxID=2896846 RepID=UPI001E4303B2|nr:hypothetical protein [Actinocorallia sp. API 0066]MCD0450585.1 hypothetical protein [Actinocorallia sp. API 0066]